MSTTIDLRRIRNTDDLADEWTHRDEARFAARLPTLFIVHSGECCSDDPFWLVDWDDEC